MCVDDNQVTNGKVGVSLGFVMKHFQKLLVYNKTGNFWTY